MSSSEAEPLSKADYEAARRALKHNWPELAVDSPDYEPRLAGLAAFHLSLGSRKFELYYNLRLPRDKNEEWSRDFMRGRISQEEFKGRLKADAERPIDFEMLSKFCESYDKRLENYGRVLQFAIRVATSTSYCDAHEEYLDGYEEQEVEIDEQVDALAEKLPLWKEQLTTVHEYLEELRVHKGLGLVKLGDIEARSAHWLATLTFMKTGEAWHSCRDVAERSQTDPNYLYATTASALFYKIWLPLLPKPQTLGERMREEFVHARVAFRQRFDVGGKLTDYPLERIVPPDEDARSGEALDENKVDKPMTKQISVFVSYAHEDETWKEELDKHLSVLKRQGAIALWNDREILPGTEWKDQIDENLESADVVLLLVSSDFLASDYCYDIEMKRAIERHDAGDARVIPIILRPVDWHGAPFGRLQALPKDAKPVADWPSQDAAFTDVAQGIRKAVQELNP